MTAAIVTAISLTLMISGILLKNALFLLSSTVSWVLFAFLMFGYTFTNAYLNTALLMFGGFMAILSGVMALNLFVSGRRGPSEDMEYEAYKKQVQKVTRRR